MTNPKPGEIFTAEIDRISGSGNAMAQARNSEFILGEIDVEPGDTVEVAYIGGEHGISLDHITNGRYPVGLPIPMGKIPICSNDDNNSLNVGDRVTVTFNDHTNLGHVVGTKDGYKIHLPVNRGHKFAGRSPTIEVEAQFKVGKFIIANRVTEEAKQENQDSEENSQSNFGNSDNDQHKDVSHSENRTDATGSEQANPETTSNMTSLEKQRKKAEKAASENPVRNVSQTVKSEYIRAPAIKKYAKCRANGNCEYCEKSAPFETENGEPYLEVHHVDELSEGGEDHPDKVIALCPTCHREVHHGAQGEIVNQEIREKLENGLAKMGQ
jgi:predicted HNH restriction endonuclease